MSDTASSGSPVLFLLFLVFLVLKLCGVISWSWWWVTAPLWIPLAIASVFGLFALAAIIAAGVGYWWANR